MLCRSCSEPHDHAEEAQAAELPAPPRHPVPARCAGCGSPVSEVDLKDLFSAKMRLLGMFGLFSEVEPAIPPVVTSTSEPGDLSVA
jgi:hypothetical protein